MIGDRRLRTNEHPTRRILAMWVLLCAIFLVVGMKGLLSGRFPDPDDALRLVQVRDLVAGQSWFDVTQYRIAPSEGSPMHWSRLVDIPLALIIAVLTPLLGQAPAETTALIAVPLLTLLAILLAIGRLAWRLFDVHVAGLACLACGLLAPLVFQLQPMRIDHHGWQIFSVALALWAISFRSAWRGGAIAGAAMAVGLSISIELLPMVAAFGGVLALRWFRDHHRRWWLVAYMQALALGLALVFFATRGWSALTQYCDAVSTAHLGFFLVTALGTGLIAVTPRLPRGILAGAFALVGAAGLGFFGLASPTCLATPFAALDPLVHEFWYVNVAEGRPLWEQSLEFAIPPLLQLLVAFAATCMLYARSRAWLREWWFEYALLLGAAIALSLLVWRSAAFAAVIGAVPLGWLVSRLLHNLRTANDTRDKLATAALTILMLMPSTPLVVYDAVVPDREDIQITLVEESHCDLRESVPLLDKLPAGTIYAPLDIGPAILVKSKHAVVATGHHRAEAAMRDVIAGFTSSSEDARALAASYGSDYVALCADLYEPRLFYEAAPKGFAAQLMRGEIPDWLEPVDIGAPRQFRVWRIRKQATANSGPDEPPA